MSQPFHEFWQSIKSPAWPNVEFWSEFVRIDPDIQKECRDQYALQQQLDKIENFEYWHCNSLYPLYRKEDWVFVNVSKCGFIHYQDFFLDRLGWQVFVPNSYRDLDEVNMFGLMMDPHRRYLKGVTEWLWKTNLFPHMNIDRIFSDIVFPDIHSAPVSQCLGSIINRVNWIPFELMTDHEVKTCMNKLFEKKSSSITVPLSHPAMHNSPKDKQQLYQALKTVFFNQTFHKNNIADIHRALVPDTIFYRNLVDKFSPDWQHLD